MLTFKLSMDLKTLSNNASGFWEKRFPTYNKKRNEFSKKNFNYFKKIKIKFTELKTPPKFSFN